MEIYRLHTKVIKTKYIQKFQCLIYLIAMIVFFAFFFVNYDANQNDMNELEY